MPRILLVEDDPDVQMILEHVLLTAGYDVETTGTMTGALDDLTRSCHPFDLVIADVKLPDGTGLEIADAAAERGTKAILMTGYAFTLPAGTHDRYELLLKPLRPIEITTAVERALSKL